MQKINKGVTQQQEITAGKNIKAGGIELSVYFMPGVGGKELTKENAEGTSHVINEIGPDFLRIRTAAVKPGTGLYEDYQNGQLTLCSDEEKLLEIRTVIERAPEIDTRVVSDHIINLLQGVEGHIVLDRQKMLDMIDGYLNKPEYEKRLYQAARRMALVNGPGDMKYLDQSRVDQIESLIRAIPDPYEWEEKMNALIGRYI